VVLIGYDLWQRKFNGDPHIIGKTIRISRWDTPPTVIGVMPPSVRFLPSPGAAQEPNYNVDGMVQFWIPVKADPARIKAMQWDVVARLRDGATRTQAESELRILASRQAQTERSFEGFTPRIELLSDELNGAGGRILMPLLGAAALVLLIACGNAAALLLMRGWWRAYAASLALVRPSDIGATRLCSGSRSMRFAARWASAALPCSLDRSEARYTIATRAVQFL
jgi:putative ABC transport system permease protein